MAFPFLYIRRSFERRQHVITKQNVLAEHIDLSQRNNEVPKKRIAKAVYRESR